MKILFTFFTEKRTVLDQQEVFLLNFHQQTIVISSQNNVRKYHIKGHEQVSQLLLCSGHRVMEYLSASQKNQPQILFQNLSLGCQWSECLMGQKQSYELHSFEQKNMNCHRIFLSTYPIKCPQFRQENPQSITHICYKKATIILFKQDSTKV